MTDLAAWLIDRIAEDEAAARAATPGPWVDTGTVLAGVSTPEYRTVAECNSTHWYVGDEDYSYPAEPEEAANAAHIARHDPARVLAECEAKRRIVKAYEFETDIPPDGTDQPPAMALRLLALPYNDRDGYDPAWAVE